MRNRLPAKYLVGVTNGRKGQASSEATALLRPEAMPKRLLAKATQTVGDYPVASMVAALVTGVLVATWVKRS